MDEILLTDSGTDTLGEKVWRSKRKFALLGITNFSKKKKGGNSTNYLECMIGLQKFNHRKYKWTPNLWTPNDFQKLLGDINWLWSTIRITALITNK